MYSGEYAICNNAPNYPHFTCDRKLLPSKEHCFTFISEYLKKLAAISHEEKIIEVIILSAVSFFEIFMLPKLSYLFILFYFIYIYI